MQDTLVRQAGIFDTWAQPKTGPAVYTPYKTSSRIFQRRQTSYIGKRPVPFVPHPYSFRIDDVSLWLDWRDDFTTGGANYGSGPILTPTGNSGITFEPGFAELDAVLDRQALEKLTDKVRGDLDLTIDLSEAGHTVKMFNMVEKVIDYSTVFRRKYGALKSAANAWLEYTYGVRPLLGSIYGAADESLRTVINRSAKFSSRASGVLDAQFVWMNTKDGAVRFPCSGPIKRSVTYGVDVRTDQFDISRWGSLNPVSIAWELTPYSFVADWVFHIGGYLRNMETYLLNANKFRSGYRTILAAGVAKVDYRDKTLVSGASASHRNWSGQARLLTIDRTILTSYPAPSLPSFRAELGSSRLLSAASLLAQKLRRR